MVTYAQLKDVQPAQFDGAADGWQKVSGAAGAAMDRVNNEIAAKLRDSLSGEAADAALSRLKRLADNFQYTRDQTNMVRSALSDLATELRAAKRKLDDAVTDAQTAGFSVEGDGSVKWTDADPAQGESKKTEARGYADRISDAVRDATTADATCTGLLNRLKARNDLTVTDADWADAARDRAAAREALGDDVRSEDIPEGKSPEENAQWWRGLSAEEKADFLAVHPGAVGALDGLPSDVRDDANRSVLAETEGAYRTELDDYPDEPPKYVPGPSRQISDEWQEWHDRKEHLESSLDDMGLIQDRFDQTGEEGLPEAYLLGFSTEGDGRAIVANGNPDSAHHTAVYVPGTGSDVDGFGSNMRRGTDIWRESQALVPGQEVSSISWIGYDAPDDVVKDAPFGHYADDAGPDLNRFMDGIDVAHDPGRDSHTTVTAHSYGTTVVGSAARQGDLNADDVVFAGSPGVQVGRASDMDVPDGHVWNQEADGDHVPDLGRLGHGHREWHWDSGFDWVIPSDDRFGANQMSTDTEGHSGYWDPGSESSLNQARVITGLHEEVQRE